MQISYLYLNLSPTPQVKRRSGHNSTRQKVTYVCTKDFIYFINIKKKWIESSINIHTDLATHLLC